LYARAADQAAGALAFEHAARLYQIALELHAVPAEQARILQKRLGDALASAGRGALAAQAYLAAAGSAGAGAAETLELKRLASTQLLLGGHVDEGLALLRTLLVPLGLSVPDTPRAALWPLLWQRAMLRLRGDRFTSRDESRVSPLDLTRIDLCWSAVAGLSMLEPLRGALFQARGLRLALRAGEPFRIARGLAMEAAHESAAGLSAAPRVARLLKAAEDLARRINSPHALGTIELVRGISSVMFGQWRAGHAALEAAELLFRNRCTGVAWERDTGHNFALRALLQMGQLVEFRRRWTVLHQEARERGDFHATATLTTLYLTMIKLAGNEMPESLGELEAALARRAGRPLNLQLSSAFEALIHVDLYRGDLTRAQARLQALWPDYSCAQLYRIQTVRIRMLELRARTAVAIAEKSSQPAPLLRQAKGDARRLRREGQSWALAHSLYIRAAIAACREQTPVAIDELTRAAAAYDAAEMPLHARIIRYRLGEVLTGNEARILREESETGMREQGIASPVRWAGMYAPGFARISNASTETTY
jgi:hypothetical protein